MEFSVGPSVHRVTFNWDRTNGEAHLRLAFHERETASSELAVDTNGARHSFLASRFFGLFSLSTRRHPVHLDCLELEYRAPHASFRL